MHSIDLNADLGENTPERPVSDDEAMLRTVTSANVSCGFHAGNPAGILQTLSLAARSGVAIGAHPSYRDFENFGRIPRDLDSATLQEQVEFQLGSLDALARSVGGSIRYVKPHGALYNTIAHDERQATAVVQAVRAFDPALTVLGLAGGVVLEIAQRSGLATAAEMFADRTYTPTGALVPRSEPGAVLHGPHEVAARTVRFVQHGVIESIAGTDVAVHADSICVHGDSPGAVAIAGAVRSALTASGIELRPFVGAHP